MKRNSRWIGAGLGAAIAVSAVVLTPIAGAANDGHPASVCIDDGSALHCTVPTSSTSVPAGSGREVTVVREPSGRLDAKDHPNYGSVAKSSPGRSDAKDHPGYGQADPDAPPPVHTPLVR